MTNTLSNPINKHHLKSTGAGILGARAAYACMENTYQAFLKHFKKKPVTELYICGRCPPDIKAPVSWSVTAYGDDAVEIEWLKENVTN